MPNPYFQFKQFTVRHDKCAMKVGTDGVLLGAWAPVQDVKRILDVGAGSGLISLQLAQRNPEAVITSVEIDPAAAAQAQENIQSSPWSNRMEVVCCDFRKYHPEDKFDLIVSNPPYFVDALRCPDNQRCMARHTSEHSRYDWRRRWTSCSRDENRPPGIRRATLPRQSRRGPNERRSTCAWVTRGRTAGPGYG